MHARLASLLGLILTLTLPAHAARIDELLARAEFKAAQPLAQKLLAKDSPTADERAQLYAWLFDSDDLATLDRRLRVTLTGADISAVDQQAAGRLALEARDFERAQAAFKQAEALATSSAERAAALKGQGQIAYQKRDYDNAIKLEEASTALKADADALLAQAETLIRLGRTADAITALERAIQLNPLHEQAHYFLGNGYARKNYSELKAQNPAAFKQAMALVHRASDAFDRGQYQAARRLSQQALLRCPQLGRAHAVLAKALEFERMAIDVHRAAAEARFAAQAMPVVPGIEQYVSNWASLSKRHQKRVALSVAPWAAFIPILVEGGARHSIKPLGMLLSETPEAKGLRDARIDYDSRLWDDVRGMGGYNTVTGIEDVERSVFDRYNTVLHELTHQVHGVLTAEQSREIQELYRRAKERDVAAKSTGRSAFLSRYAGGSVWEYFAEGANSFESPRRDAFDHREIVRERLVEMDPELQALVRRLFTLKDTRASLPVALVGAGDHALGEGRLQPALAHYERAAKLAPTDERVMAAQLYGQGVAGDAAKVGSLAKSALATHAGSGMLRTTAAEALWHSGKPLPEVVAELERGRAGLQGEDAFRVDLAIGDARRKLGDIEPALAAYRAALAYQADSPEALWGEASTLALAERWDAAFARYEQVVRLRTGVVPLRADYARDLLRAGRLPAAAEQLAAAKLLDPDEPNMLAVEALRLRLSGDAAGARTLADGVLKAAPWCDLAAIVRGITPASSTPSYVFDEKRSTWVSIHEHPAVEDRVRVLLQRP